MSKKVGNLEVILAENAYRIIYLFEIYNQEKNTLPNQNHNIMKTKVKFLAYASAVIVMSLFVIVGCSDDETDPVNPLTLTTLAVTEITETSAKSGGNITDDGGGEITARGVVWSTDVNPSLDDHIGITQDGTGSGEFHSEITDLSPAAKYYIRAYATNSAGTSYGNEVMFETIQSAYLLTLEVNPQEAGSVTGAGEYQEGEHVNISATAEEGWKFVNWTGDTQYLDDADSAEAIVNMPADNVTLTANFQEEDSNIIYGDGVTDIDGNEYVTVIIGNQEWMAENLRVTRDANGNDIDRYCYDDDPDWCELYGGLYSWHTVMNGEASSSNNPSDVQGICPTGWHVPSDAEWTQLVDYMEAQGFPNSSVVNGAGNALKSCLQNGSPLGGDCDTSEHPRWNSHGTHYGFDEFGFSALPGGYRSPYGSFYNLGTHGRWYSSTQRSMSNGWARTIRHSYGTVLRLNYDKARGVSLRCVRDIVRTEDD